MKMDYSYKLLKCIFQTYCVCRNYYINSFSMQNIIYSYFFKLLYVYQNENIFSK